MAQDPYQGLVRPYQARRRRGKNTWNLFSPYRCTAAAWALDLRSYLFGDVPLDEHDQELPVDDQDGDGLIDERLDRLQGGGGADGELLQQEVCSTYYI